MPAPKRNKGSKFCSISTRKKKHQCRVRWKQLAQRIVLAYLYVSEINSVEVREHLVDLSWVLEHGTGRLGQMVQAGVATQCLREGAYTHHLKKRSEEKKLRVDLINCYMPKQGRIWTIYTRHKIYLDFLDAREQLCKFANAYWDFFFHISLLKHDCFTA